MSKSNQPIGLTELIEQVKRELLSTAPGSDKDIPFLFVESIELELQVVVSRGGEGSIKIDVLSIGGVEAGGNITQDRTQTVKVTLSSLFDKQQLIEFYKTLHSSDILTSIHQNMKAVLKGESKNSAEDTVL